MVSHTQFRACLLEGTPTVIPSKSQKGTPAKADPVKQEAFIQAYEKLLTEASTDEPILFGGRCPHNHCN